MDPQKGLGLLLAVSGDVRDRWVLRCGEGMGCGVQLGRRDLGCNLFRIGFRI
jgi:hypothetical protein